MREIEVNSEESMQVIDVTDRVADLVAGTDDGLAFVSIPHTTATLLLSEDDEELRRDIIRVVQRWLKDCGPFEHIKKNNPNTVAHVLSSFGGTSLTIGISNGNLDLGTYQRILFLELDGPKTRTIRLRTLPM
ncbi:MAG: YjbQ family protein [Spirochaetaceae bacterium]|nr:MAG: YjbQ family protein [Spirochaetaceae bacterium]